MKKRTIDISGFGGGYEAMCQRMLWRGIRHLEARGSPVTIWEKATEYKNVYGVMATEGPELKAMEQAMLPPDDNDCTGAMHQAVMGHLRFIHKNGMEGWLVEMAPHRTDPGDMYDVDDETGRPITPRPR